MADVLFRNPPHPNLLQQLAKGLLEQNHHLTRAVRLWALLRWLYSDQGYSALPGSFTYADWHQAFFSETHQNEKREDLCTHQNTNCACIKTTRQWLYELEIPVDEWQKSLQKQVSISDTDLENFLQDRLFAQVRKSLQCDLDLLVTWRWLQRVPSQTGRSKHYRRWDVLPISHQVEDLQSEGSWTIKEQVYVAETLEMLGFLDPNIPLLAEQISEHPYEETRRVFLYVDYLVPESTEKQDDVDQLQGELQEIWDSGEIQPLLLTYHSAHLGLIKECVVYPVCIYYMERAKYLCAYGSTPKDEINWHNYRLDRIVSKRLVCLDWYDPRVPQLLREQYEDEQLPTIEIVKSGLEKAWGYDFYKKQSLLILRFERDFHHGYIQGISLHKTFTAINYEQVTQLIKEYTPNPEHQRVLLNNLQCRPNTDVYYKAFYRVQDYHVIRRLRALGSKAEVMLPWDLRQEIALELHKAWNLYQ